MPVRHIAYVEVGKATPEQVTQLVASVAAAFTEKHGSSTYIIPMRNGRITTDLQIEHEFLETARKLCEVNEAGEIVLKGGATEVQVIRERIE